MPHPRIYLSRKNLSEVEQDTKEAYLHRRELVKLLVENISVDRNEDGRAKVDITYSFGPPPEESASIVDGARNSLEFLTRGDPRREESAQWESMRPTSRTSLWT